MLHQVKVLAIDDKNNGKSEAESFFSCIFWETAKKHKEFMEIIYDNISSICLGKASTFGSIYLITNTQP